MKRSHPVARRGQRLAVALWLSSSLQRVPSARANDSPPQPTRSSSDDDAAAGPSPGSAPLSLDALSVATPARWRPGAVDYNVSTAPEELANYLWPVAGVVGINLTLWSIPYALGVPFAQVTPSVWRENFQTGFQWDDNEFEVNQFAHPYQGGMYFTAARVNGRTFWEAVPYTMFGLRDVGIFPRNGAAIHQRLDDDDVGRVLFW